VGFSSAQAGWSFTLQSFSQLYCEVYGVKVDALEFARRLWGDVYYHPDTRTFRKKPPRPDAERSFVQFILEPLYKIYSQVLRGSLLDLLAPLTHGLYLLNALTAQHMCCEPTCSCVPDDRG
jgi:U5 small nuclear ribonucleoprotein component